MRSRPAAAPAFGRLLLLAAAAALLLPGVAAAGAGRIVGNGRPSRAAGAVVALTESEEDGGKVFCTGTLVAKNAVLTAAHCFPAARTGGLVLIGATDLPHTEGCPPKLGGEYETHHIRDVFVPDAYDGGGKHDLAIVRLSAPTSLVKPAKLGLNYKAVKRCRKGTASGWGYTETDTFTESNSDPVDTRPCRLQTATLPMWSPTQCEKRVADGRWSSLKINDCSQCRTLICAGQVNPSTELEGEPGTSICRGDSGGPLFDCKGRLAGVTSFGPVPCGYAAPARFARLSEKENERWLRSLQKRKIVNFPRKTFKGRG